MSPEISNKELLSDYFVVIISFMFWEYITTTGIAVVEILLLAAAGYFLVKRNILQGTVLDALSNLTVKVTLPCLIFYKLIKDFSFSIYPNWWIFPLISILITVLGLFAAKTFLRFIHGSEYKKQFTSLLMYQNSGYLPLALVSGLLPKDKSDVMLIYLFLFLLGFNLIIWSFGVHLLVSQQDRKFEYKSLFNPPVIATLLSLFLILVKVDSLIPAFVLRQLKVLGGCTVPVVMLIVGGSLAQIKLSHINKRGMCLLVLAKLVILPLAGLFAAVKLNLPYLIGLLVIMELAVPSATNLSVIIRHYKKEDLLISQGIFFTHIFSIVTIPLFLSWYFVLSAAR